MNAGNRGTSICRRFGAGMLLLAVLLPFSGCMQLETNVKLNEDSTVTVTERLRFSRELLDMGKREGPALDVASLLTRKAALERMAHMGKGMTLVSHEVRNAEAGSRESITVYSIPDLNELKYHNVFLGYGDRATKTLGRFQLFPKLWTSWAGFKEGEMAVRFVRTQGSGPAPTPKPKSKSPAPPRPAPTPFDDQILRELRPAFKDMFRDFMLQLTFESYAPIHTGFGRVNTKLKAKKVSLISVTDRQLDRHGQELLDNEEVMLDLLKVDPAANDVVRHVGGLIHWGSRHSRWKASEEIWFRPSRPLYDKYLKGKKFYEGHKRQKPRPVPAFEAVGYKPQ